MSLQEITNICFMDNLLNDFGQFDKSKFTKKIDGKKSVLGCGKYKELELNSIKENAPLTQLDTSDRQIRNIEKKRAKVQGELKKQGFK